MALPTHAALADALLPVVLEAGRLILDTRARGLNVDTKADRSPVTEADRKSEELLTAALHIAAPGIAVIAEEASAAGAQSLSSATFFAVDPLDGTRDFVAGRDEFTINIGLVDGGRPTFGLIYAPARSELFLTPAAGVAAAATVDVRDPVRGVADLALTTLRVRPFVPGHGHALLSRSETGPDYDARVKALGGATKHGVSSSIKFCQIARGEADLYPRFGPTCEWDIAAGQAILEAAGGTLTQLDGQPMVYGKVAAGFLNGGFVARGRTPQ